MPLPVVDAHLNLAGAVLELRRDEDVLVHGPDVSGLVDAGDEDIGYVVGKVVLDVGYTPCVDGDVLHVAERVDLVADDVG